MIKMRYFTIFSVLCFIVFTIFSINIKVVSAETELSINAKSSILIDSNTGTILYENNANDKLQVASIVKLMTTLITIEKIEAGEFSLDTVLTTTENSSSMGGSQAFIDPYSKYTINDMLKSVIIASANDSSVALAEFISGSEDNFVKLMNEKAKNLGLSDTHYVNCTGLGEPGQYSTAKDVAKLLNEVIKHDLYHKYSTIWIDELTHNNGRKTELVNTNKLIRYFKDCDSGKTGSTDEAGYCLSASAKRDNMRLISVVLGANTSKDRFNESSKLLNYGFSNFKNCKIIDGKESVQEIPVARSSTKTTKIYPKEDFYKITKINEKQNIEKNIEVFDKIVAPVKSGEEVGKLILSENGIIIKEIPLVIKDNILQFTFKDSFKEVVNNWNFKKVSNE